MLPAAGDKLGPYEIISQIGQGGMGHVFRAHDPRMGRDVAIKVAAERFSERFEHEVRAVAALNHPNICQIYDVGPNYLVMELIEGPSPRGPLPESEVLNIAKQIAAALNAAHERGFVHRDLKPANIKVGSGGIVKVLDFGLAKHVETSPDGPTITMGVTAVGAVVGTPAYMAPEQAEGKPAGTTADIWAFGVVLFELLTGQRAFKGDSVQTTLAAVLATEPDLSKAPPRFDRLLRSCLKKDPAERLSSIRDWRLLVDEAATEPAPAKHRGAILPWLVAAAGIALGAFGLFRNRDESTPAPQTPARFSVPIPGGIGRTAMFALSPDARNLAISASEDGQFRLRIRALDELESRVLPGTEGARFPFWSPDSKQIGFFADGKLKSVLVSGGEPTVIAPVGATVLGGTWGRQGKIVISQDRNLYKVNEHGGVLELLYKDNIHYYPSFLPDGQHFLFLVDSGVHVGSLDASGPVKILPDFTLTVFSPDGYLVFTRQDRLMAQPFDPDSRTLSGTATPLTREAVTGSNLATKLSAAAGGAVVYQPTLLDQLAWMDRAGNVKEKLGRPQVWTNFRLNSSQTKVAFDLAEGEAAVFDLQRSTPDWRTSSGKGAVVPIFSPDGKQLAFTSRRTGRWAPYLTSALDPKQERQLADVGVQGGYPVDWSPDGKYLLYWGDEDLWIVPVSGSEKPYRFAQSKYEERAGVFSPDSKWIAYSSDESGRYEIYLQPLATGQGERYTVSTNGGSSPAWRRDGKELFYVAADGRLTALTLTISGSKVEFGKPVSLFPVDFSDFHRSYEPSLNGQRFLVATPVSPASVTVLLNWPKTAPK